MDGNWHVFFCRRFSLCFSKLPSLCESFVLIERVFRTNQWIGHQPFLINLGRAEKQKNQVNYFFVSTIFFCFLWVSALGLANKLWVQKLQNKFSPKPNYVDANQIAWQPQLEICVHIFIHTTENDGNLTRLAQINATHPSPAQKWTAKKNSVMSRSSAHSQRT